MAQSCGHICQCLTRILSLRRDSPLTIAGGRRRTGGEFAERVLSLARGLTECGLGSGDVVAIAALNSDYYMEWLLAITYVGGIVAPLNYRWSFEEARSALELVSPSILVVDESCSSWAQQLRAHNSIASLRLHVFIGASKSPSLDSDGNVLAMDSLNKPLQGISTLDLVWAPKELALICFTSGTTGRPKGVAISHTALIIQALAKIAVIGYSEDDVYLHTAPLCHIGGISSCIAMLMAVGCHVLTPKFDAKSSFQAIEEHQVTSLITVPAMMSDLISYGRKADRGKGGETVNKILNGGGSLSLELISGANCLFPHANIIAAYGMTEACSSLTFMILCGPTLEKSGKPFLKTKKVENDRCHQHEGLFVGKPAPHVELRIAGDHSNCGPSLVGRILTRGLHVMVGYWNKTTAVISDSFEDGWLDTGDIGWLDDNGDLWLVGRAKDQIKSGGENVYPEEVESVLSRHPGISKVVVIGIPDVRLTEKIVACVTIRKDWDWVDQNSTHPSHASDVKVLSADILQKFCRQRNLTGYHRLARAKMIISDLFVVAHIAMIQDTEGVSHMDEAISINFHRETEKGECEKRSDILHTISI